MSVRRLIVEVDLDGLNVTEFCREHGVSTWFFYQLRKRFAAGGEAGLEPRRRVAKTVANRTPDWVEDLVVEKRKELDDGGWDAGPATIWSHLVEILPAGLVPSEATIWRILTRRGFITPQPKKAPKHAHRTFTAERANECWQLDDIEWELADGSEVKIITLIDDCTRICPGLKAVETVNGEAAFDAFSTAAGQWGWPERFLSDNAKAYKISLARAVGLLGVDHRHGRPNHPQTQGKVERFHQTLQRWLQAQPRAASLEELQTQLDIFADLYNKQRPHRAIGRRTPASVWEQTPKAGPDNQPDRDPQPHPPQQQGGRQRQPPSRPLHDLARRLLGSPPSHRHHHRTLLPRLHRWPTRPPTPTRPHPKVPTPIRSTRKTSVRDAPRHP